MRPTERETQPVRLAPLGLVTAVAIAEATDVRHAAAYLLLAAIPATFAAGVALYGDFMAGETVAEDVDLMRLALYALALSLVLAAATITRLALLASGGALTALALAEVLAVAPARVLVALRGER